MTRVLVMAKAGPPGTAKTRLIPTLGAARAHAVHQAMAAATIARAVRWAGRRVHVALDVADDPPAWTAGQRIHAQGPGDLGIRLQRVSQVLFADDGRPLIILGTDAPDLPLDRLDAARAACAAGRPAICPSADGGYNLIALPAAFPALFEGISWGTGEVAAQTRARASGAGLDLHETPGWEDVDDLADLRRLLARVAESVDPDLRQLHAALAWVKLL